MGFLMARTLLCTMLLMLTGSFVACTLTIDEEALSGSCDSSQKACELAERLECVDLSDPDYGCARPSCIPCNLHKAQATCSPASGQCVIAACIGSWANCDRTDANGCEVNLNNDPSHCGRCGTACPSKPNAEVACGSARCYIRVCDDGFKDCNHNFDDGCETDVRVNVAHCGACDSPCAGTCEDGVCVE